MVQNVPISMRLNMHTRCSSVHQSIKEGDVVFVKLNCEGAECDIIDDLINSNEIIINQTNDDGGQILEIQKTPNGYLYLLVNSN